MFASFASQLPVHCRTTKSESTKHSMFRIPISFASLMPCTRASYAATLFEAANGSRAHSETGLPLAMSEQFQPLGHSSSLTHQSASANDQLLESEELTEFLSNPPG